MNAAMNVVERPELSIDNFEAGDIDPERFDHRSHIYVAWLYIQQFELADAIGRFDAALRRLVTKLGAQSKYHATLTWFFLLLIAQRSDAGETWADFCAKNSDLTTNSKDVLSLYYSEELLFSDSARKRFMLPNKLLHSRFDSGCSDVTARRQFDG